MLKVLVVEDEEMIRRGIVLAVDWAALDCVVVGEASNGLEALEAVERLAPSLIITDLKMPQMDGIEMLRQLRARGNGVYVIILTAYDMSDIEDEALEAGVTAFCSKPLFTSELRSCLTSILASDDSSQPQDDRPESFRHSGRILLAEDNELNYEIASELLQEMGMEVDWGGKRPRMRG